ncbi:thioredoxin domain-containing protein 16 [Plakobranchus ocellatus]|uniref:Thioredoxin domain-containing protein 16 n=1 Tax=Plakobranchus ocellatus TaxID=259542 RepID=A0AAV4BDR3_9GAST|nr:thioredoxin domain-containing protein 16 [Plakobranchus ocellatus]
MTSSTVVFSASLLLLLLRSPSLEATSKQSHTSDGQRNMLTVNSESIQDLINSPSLSLIFFHKTANSKTIPFLKEFKKSAENLEPYDIRLAVYDCRKAKETDTACNKDEDSVFTYRNGIALMTLELDYLFDVDSIMANALHLLLLHEVPIVQSRLERLELEQSLVGKRDLIFIHPQAVGTAEHRMFMEIAHAFQDQFSFALTTDYRTIIGLQDSSELSADSSFGLWVMFCSEARTEEVTNDGDCPHTMYRGKATLYHFVQFIQKLLQKSVFHAPQDGLTSLFAMTSDDPIVYAYLKTEDQEDEVLMHILNYDLRGSAQVVIVDMNDPKSKMAATKQGLTHKLPSIRLKSKDGKMHILENEDWTVSDLRQFLLPHVFPEWLLEKSPSGDQQQSLAASEGDLADLYALIDAVESQDDQVASAVASLKHKTMSGLEHVPEFLKHGFHAAVSRSTLLMVLFYEPFDHLSMAFLRDFGVAAQILANNFSTTGALARVNCFDATDLCSEQNVTTYPTIRIYHRDGASQEDYKGPLDALSVAKTVKLLQLKSPVLLSTEHEVDQFTKGLHPIDFSKFGSSSVFLVATDAFTEAASVFKDISVDMSQVTALAVVHPNLVPQIAQRYKTSIPSLVAHNHEDKLEPVRTLMLEKGKIYKSALTSFIRASTIPAVPELTLDNFPHLFARNQPMVILFVDSTDPETKTEALTTFSTVAMSGHFSDFVFCWMDAKVKSMGLKILSEYTWTAQLPMVSVVKHRQGQVFNFQPVADQQSSEDPLQVEALTEWLNQVLAGTVNPSKILDQKEWGPPGPYYNFLNMPARFDEKWLEEQNSNTGPLEEDTAHTDNGLESDGAEVEVRKMLHDLRKLHDSPEGVQAGDTSREKVTTPDSAAAHSHTEL